VLASRRWWISIPFILALAVLIFISWSASYLFVYLHDGIVHVSPTGQITELDATGENKNLLQLGDIIFLVKGVPFAEAVPFYTGNIGGDKVEFIVERAGERLRLSIELINPPLGVILTDLVPLLVALAFWGIGVGVLSFKPADRTSNLFFLFCQATALFLASGLMSGIGPRWMSGLFNFLFWLISVFLGPVFCGKHGVRAGIENIRVMYPVV